MALDPYAPPSSDVNATTVEAPEEQGPKMIPAGRGSRLVAAWIDGFIAMPFFLGLMFALPDVFLDANAKNVFGGGSRGLGAAGVAIGLPLLLWQAQRFLATGQSLGKAVFKIKVIRSDGSLPTIQTLLMRNVLFTALNYIPVVGSFISLADAVAIFGNDHLCLHDRAAQTKVILA